MNKRMNEWSYMIMTCPYDAQCIDLLNNAKKNLTESHHCEGRKSIEACCPHS